MSDSSSCQYCGKPAESDYDNREHERKCEENPANVERGGVFG